MGNRDFFLLYPERLPLLGGAALLLASLMALPYFSSLFEPAPPIFTASSKEMGKKSQGEAPLALSLSLKEGRVPLSFPDITSEISLFQIPLPPWQKGEPPLLVQVQGREELLFPALPFRIDLAFEKGGLTFAKGPSLFWGEFDSIKGKPVQVQGKLCLQQLGGEVDEKRITLSLTPPAPQKKGAFSEGSPFHLLAEGRWWGRDLFLEKLGKKGGSERLEVALPAGGELLELSKGGWLVWEKEGWRALPSLSEGASPLYAARLEQVEERRLFLEGWEKGRYVRLEYPLSPPPPLKVRPEEFLSGVRIRSEKQISCTIEKQCLILRVGDWVLKREGRWKPLRSKEEREALLKGKLKGELFLLERIESKMGQKGIVGQLFDATHSQMIPIEVPVGASSHSRLSKTRGGR